MQNFYPELDFKLQLNFMGRLRQVQANILNSILSVNVYGTFDIAIDRQLGKIGALLLHFLLTFGERNYSKYSFDAIFKRHCV